MAYELFISYSRKDNIPRPLPPDSPSAIPNPPSKGWVTALHDEILADHRRFSTEPLRIFFDTSEIKDMDDWRHRILTGLTGFELPPLFRHFVSKRGHPRCRHALDTHTDSAKPLSP